MMLRAEKLHANDDVVLLPSADIWIAFNKPEIHNTKRHLHDRNDIHVFLRLNVDVFVIFCNHLEDEN